MLPAPDRRYSRRSAHIGPIAAFAVGLGLALGCEGKQTGSHADGASEATPQRTATAPANGFNDTIAWRGLDEGLAEARDDGRPLMMVVHASWCPQCKALRPKFHETELAQLSEHFVMVNVDQDKVPRSEQFGPDGLYVPRVMFVDPGSLAVNEQLRNPNRSQHLFYYHVTDSIVGTMKKAVGRYGRT